MSASTNLETSPQVVNQNLVQLLRTLLAKATLDRAPIQTEECHIARLHSLPPALKVPYDVDGEPHEIVLQRIPTQHCSTTETVFLDFNKSSCQNGSRPIGIFRIGICLATGKVDQHAIIFNSYFSAVAAQRNSYPPMNPKVLLGRICEHHGVELARLEAAMPGEGSLCESRLTTPRMQVRALL